MARSVEIYSLELVNLTSNSYLVPTPFASHAFHFVDGYLQSVPYHLFIYIFPLQRMLYLCLFVAVNFWSIFVSLYTLFLNFCFIDDA